MKHCYLLGAGLLAAAALEGCQQPAYVLDVYSTMRYETLALPTAADTMRLTTVDFVSAKEGFVGGAGGAVFATADGGQTWARRPAPSAGTVNKLLFTSAAAGWAGTANGFFRTTNGGQSWQSVLLYDPYNGAISNVQDVQFVTAQVGYAVGERGGIFKTTNGGNSWSSLQSRRDKAYLFRGVSFTSPDSGLVVGAEQALWRTTNGGRTWDMYDYYSGGSGGQHFDVLRYGRGAYLLASYEGFRAYGPPDASGYSSFPQRADEDMGRLAYGLASAGPKGPWVAVGDRLVVRYHEGYSQNESTPWTYVHQPDGSSFRTAYYAADFADASTFYAVGAHGTIHRFHYQ